MKSKDLKLMRKKLARANKGDCNVPCTEIFLVDDAESNSKTLSIRHFRSGEIPEGRFQQCLNLFEKNMGGLYRSSSWKFDMKEKEREMRHDTARFLVVVRDNDDNTNENDRNGQELSSQEEGFVGFVHYRFEADDDENPTCCVLYLYELQVHHTYQRHGLGTYLMKFVEKIAEQSQMPKVMLTVFKSNKEAMNFYIKKLNYVVDVTSPSKHNEPNADYEILSRRIID